MVPDSQTATIEWNEITQKSIDSFTTDENGQFTTGYVCDSDWTIREISPSEGYLLDSTIHKVGAEPELLYHHQEP